MNGLHQLIMTLAALALVGNAAAFTTDEFMTAETYKSARAQYHVVGDTTWGSDVDVYTLAAVTLQWPTRFGDNDVTALQDSLLTQFFFHHDVDVDAAIASVMTHPLHYGEGTLEEVDEIPEGDSALVLEATLDVSTVGFCDRFIVYRADYYINEGGVHPNYFSQYLNYDIRDNQVLDYNDIFVARSTQHSVRSILVPSLPIYHAAHLLPPASLPARGMAVASINIVVFLLVYFTR